MQQGLDNFYKILCEGKHKRRSFEFVNQAHLEAFPQYRNNPEQSAHLWSSLEYLVEKNQLELPSQAGKSWITGNPRLPKWVSIITTAEPDKSPIPEKYAWHPKIAPFVEDLNVSQKKSAFKISEYLKLHKGRGSFEVLIPRRERSLKIFGDEKKLDRLASKGLLLSGNLKLTDIGCHDVGWPMPHQIPSIPCPGKPFLIVENHHTYYSFCRWNERARQYTGIGYGAGEAFSTVETDHIDTIIDPTGASSINYFGDIDPKGISIPARVSNARVQKNLVPIDPAIALYQWLLNHGIQRDLIKKSQPSFPEGWLPDLLAGRVKDLFISNNWLPQEALGYEELLSGEISLSL